jgi:hypothetical protein
VSDASLAGSWSGQQTSTSFDCPGGGSGIGGYAITVVENGDQITVERVDPNPNKIVVQFTGTVNGNAFTFTGSAPCGPPTPLPCFLDGSMCPGMQTSTVTGTFTATKLTGDRTQEWMMPDAGQDCPPRSCGGNSTLSMTRSH